MIPTLKNIPSIEQMDMSDKSVFMRLDLNVPLKDGIIQDETRIQAALPSIKYALGQRAKLIIASHLGRPRSPEDHQKLSLEPIASRLSELLEVEVILIEEPSSDVPSSILRAWKPRQIILLENLRFAPGEEANDESFSRSLARNIDIYINDAFGASHRSHSSIVGLPPLVERSGVGFLMKKEIELLDRLLHTAEHPFALVVGGAKVMDKIGVMNNLIDKADVFIVGGAMAYTFLKAQAIPIGHSLVEREKISIVKDFLKRVQMRDKKCLFPIDHVVIPNSNGNTPPPTPPTYVNTNAGVSTNVETKKSNSTMETHNSPHKVVSTIEDGWKAVDIGPQTTKLFREGLTPMKTIFWNGPMGMFENHNFAHGTLSIAKCLAHHEAFTFVGGGDSVAALNSSGYAQDIDHISTGGGASLEFLQGISLPGLEALRQANRKKAT